MSPSPRGKLKPRPAPKLTREYLETAALTYLNRFDSSVNNLRRVLRQRVSRALRRGGSTHTSGDAESLVQQCQAWIEDVLERLQASGVLNDKRYAGSLVRGERSRGASRRMILLKLGSRGVARDVSGEILSAVDEETSDRKAELLAAQTYVRRRRLGYLRPEAERLLRRDKDLAALLRRGFSGSVARLALQQPVDSSDDD